MKNINKKIWYPPPFSAKLARIFNPDYCGTEESAIKCSGVWVGGSGGHRLHLDKNCPNKVVWWHPDDAYSYCAAHIPKRDISMYQLLWYKSRYILILSNLSINY